MARAAPRGEKLPREIEQPEYPQLHPLARYPVGLGLESHRRGPDRALVTIVEFSDFDCGYCRKSRPTLARLRAEFAGEVRFAYRHFVLDGYADSKLAAEAAVAAGEQGKFWEFHDRLYAAEGRVGRVELEKIARSIGLDLERFRGALDDRRHGDRVAADTAEGRLLGLRGTPTFFINGSPAQGALPFEQFRAVVKGKLFEARELAERGIDPDELYARVASAPPPPDDELSMDDTQLHIEALLSCLADKTPQARAAYDEIEDPARRADVASECARSGITIGRPR